MIPVSCTYFPGAKRKALTLSYDDGVTQDRRLVEIFNRYGLKASFHVNSGISGGNRLPIEEFASLYQGHEISAHSVTHPSLTTSPLEQLAWQILEDRRRLEAVAGYAVRGMSYPNGQYSQSIISHLPHYGIEYARTTLSHGKYTLPENFLEWHPTIHHSQDLLQKAEEFLTSSAHPGNPPLLFYVWGHSYEFDRNLPNNNWEIIEKFAERMGPESDSVWFATNIEIVDYLNALKRLRISADGHIVENHSHITLWVGINGQPCQLAPGERYITPH
jgi:peptidoglycan/xylan/chitin deacetylase (PgdA/CDA1 family)